MPEFDVLIRGARDVPELGIADGKIAAFSTGSAAEEVDATGLLLLPGVLDAHVHFNEPGRTDWEGWKTGSQGAAAGGVTTVCDMPLNSTPPLVDAAAFDAKHRAAAAQAVCDFAFWGGLTPQSLDALEPLANCGVIGFKAFMSHSGISDFPKVDLACLRRGMKRAAALDLPVAVHAEFDDARDPHGTTVRDYLASRPVDMELNAIRAALDIAGDTGCALHVVHVSSAQGIQLITAAKKAGVDVTCETCPHYLIFTGDDMEQLGAVAKCAPPMRDAANRERLREDVLAGRVDTVGSDHSPSPWALKEPADFLEVWGGISGIQHLLPLLLDLDLPPAQLSQLVAEHPARRFRLPGKGRLQIGMDADLVFVEMGTAHEIFATDLMYRHRHSPYVGRTLRACVRRTMLRGRTVFHDGAIVSPPGGRLITPQH
jgi:allantoinase